MLTVRDATAEDLPAIAEIYAEACANSQATFDLEPLSLEAWQQTLDDRDPAIGHLLIVATEDDTVLGYAKSSKHKEKGAYITTVETSVYIHVDHRRRGAGDALYRELLARLESSDALLAVAGLTIPNEASERLHMRHGFTEVGVFHGVGVKLGRQWDVRWFERPLT